MCVSRLPSCWTYNPATIVTYANNDSISVVSTRNRSRSQRVLVHPAAYDGQRLNWTQHTAQTPSRHRAECTREKSAQGTGTPASILLISSDKSAIATQNAGSFNFVLLCASSSYHGIFRSFHLAWMRVVAQLGRGETAAAALSPSPPGRDKDIAEVWLMNCEGLWYTKPVEAWENSLDGTVPCYVLSGFRYDV